MPNDEDFEFDVDAPKEYTPEELERIAKVKRLVQRAAVYVPASDTGESEGESIQINYWDTEEDINEDWFPGYFYGTGEETGAEYQVSYDSVDLEHDQFYELVLLDTDLE